MLQRRLKMAKGKKVSASPKKKPTPSQLVLKSGVKKKRLRRIDIDGKLWIFKFLPRIQLNK